jgi:hypothetical protein
MKKLTTFVSGLLALICSSVCRANTPQGFSWINLESDKATMAQVRRSFLDPSMTAIREVGVQGGFALVMIVSREDGAPTPDYDQWSIYNLSLKTGEKHLLISGYGVRLLEWIGTKKNELAVTYYDCWECEPATLFTTLRFSSNDGWSARWLNKTQSTPFPQPGAILNMTDAGDAFDGEDTQQIYAILSQPNGEFAVGTWLRLRNLKSGKLLEDVERCSINPTTQADVHTKLNGKVAVLWERELCEESKILMAPSGGQKSAACRMLVKARTSLPSTTR